jgi:glycosyltransferase involved in cell wall biosynthesis
VRVVFDAFWWVSGPTSLQRVLREIVLAWRATFPDDEIALVVPRKHLRDALEDVPPGVSVHGSRARPQALLAARAVEPLRRRLSFDAVITQNFATRSGGVSGVYLHDVLFRTNPEWFTRTERAYFAFMVRWLGRADVVFSSTASEADRIRENARPKRVVPVGLGLSSELVEAPDRIPLAGLNPGGYLLTVGRLNVRKNVAGTVHAALDAGAATPEHPLVLVGAGDGSIITGDSRIRAASESGAVRFAGHVNDAQLRWLYENTRLFIFLSLGEGFGMPPVEARHFGAPVLVSDLPVFRENLGNEASYVDPLDGEAIAEAIALLMSAGGVRAARSEMAERHDWARTVRVMREELASLVPATASSPRRRSPTR